MIKGILFDFDGTLANTIDLIVATFEYTCTRVLGFVPPRQEIINTIGMPLVDALALLSGQPDRVEELRQHYAEFNAANHDRMLRPIEGVSELLPLLKERGLKLAIVTSKKPPMLLRGMELLGITPYIDAIVTVVDTEKHKPAPEPMLLACDKLALRPEQCLCVGDSHLDIISGNAAGAVTVAVEYTLLDWQKILSEGQPDYTIARPLDLLGLVDSINCKE